MSNYEVIGIVVAGLVTILGLLGTLVKLIITPVNELTLTVSKLDSTIERLNSDNIALIQQSKQHTEKINNIELALARNKIV